MKQEVKEQEGKIKNLNKELVRKDKLINCSTEEKQKGYRKLRRLMRRWMKWNWETKP